MSSNAKNVSDELSSKLSEIEEALKKEDERATDVVRGVVGAQGPISGYRYNLSGEGENYSIQAVRDSSIKADVSPGFANILSSAGATGPAGSSHQARQKKS